MDTGWLWVFYHVLRYREIIEWSESENRAELSPQLDRYSMKKMEETKFEELTIRLGYPYLYGHHGNCEHLLVFTDLRYVG